MSLVLAGFVQIRSKIRRRLEGEAPYIVQLSREGVQVVDFRVFCRFSNSFRVGPTRRFTTVLAYSFFRGGISHRLIRSCLRFDFLTQCDHASTCIVSAYFDCLLVSSKLRSLAFNGGRVRFKRARNGRVVYACLQVNERSFIFGVHVFMLRRNQRIGIGINALTSASVNYVNVVSVSSDM